ncbi:PAS domain S-box protein [Kamptonema cortianum]|nr:PAS domain S-box protein [Kamptonema cortianum]
MSDTTITSAIERYLKNGFELIFHASGQYAFKCRSESAAYDLLCDMAAIDALAQLAQKLKQPSLPLIWDGCPRPLNVLQNHTLAQLGNPHPRIASFDSDSRSDPCGNRPSLKDLSVVSDAELAFAIDSSKTAACITRIRNSKILYANFAVEQTHGKPVDEAIGESIDILWHPDELDRLSGFLDRDRQVNDIRYWTWKWVWDESDRLWVRSKQNLVGSFWKIQFKGVPCRLSIGVHAI